MSAMDAFWAAPPVSRTITAAIVVVTLATWMSILNIYYVVFLRYKIFQLFVPEIWRLVTPFLITGPQLGLIFDPYFLFTYGKALETGSVYLNQPGDFFTYLVFVCAVIVLIAGFLMQQVLFLQPLILALAYTHSQENPNGQMTFFVFKIRSKYLPYCMLLMTFVMAGPTATYNQATGLVAAHLHMFLTRIWPSDGGGYNPIRTPQIVRRWFAQPSSAGTTRAYGTAFQSRPAGSQAAAPAGRSGGWTSGFNTGSWGGRGSGRRLGGD